MLRFEIISRTVDFAVVRFFHSEWKAKNAKNGVDTNTYQPYDHHIRLPVPVEGEDYETITLTRQIMEAFRSIQVKMESRSL